VPFTFELKLYFDDGRYSEYKIKELTLDFRPRSKKGTSSTLGELLGPVKLPWLECQTLGACHFSNMVWLCVVWILRDGISFTKQIQNAFTIIQKYNKTAAYAEWIVVAAAIAGSLNMLLDRLGINPSGTGYLYRKRTIEPNAPSHTMR
jgi:hypothetical protein